MTAHRNSRQVFSARALSLMLGGLFTVFPQGAPARNAVKTSDARPAEAFIQDVTVFDVRKRRMVPHLDIVVRDTRIAEIRPTTGKSLPAKTMIRGAGKFAIPGLFDNHVHFARLEDDTAGLFLAFGVTSVRDMGTEPGRILALRRRITYGKVYGPRIVQACGPMLEGRGEPRPDHWLVTNPASAFDTVRRIAQLGLDCVKVRTYKNLDTLRALSAAARHHRLPFVGHAPEELKPAEAFALGQRSFEHAFYPYPLSALAEAERRSLLEAWVRDGSAVVPTLVAWQPAARPAEDLLPVLDDYGADAEFRLPAGLLEHWKKGVETHRKENRGSPGWREAIRTATSDVGEMFRAGVLILPGTDTGAPFVVPGSALHEELSILVREVGLTPAEALASATLESATFLGREDDLGAIEPGRIGDIVILDANPLESIENTRRIDAVVFRGEVLPLALLNRFKQRTKG